ncbi:protein TANC2-like isoform X2 [Tachypleus tridentatus]|uniref:protein TANC2-like isoform X2 n=1 Tax=Tachypleus tridentatus TaxID=6853 RepID=UPI003FD57C4A
MMRDYDTNVLFCPSCNMPFDKGKRRPLIDRCGHESCFTCISNTERCNVCVSSEGSILGCNQRLDSLLTARPQLKTNGHFRTYMQVRKDGFQSSKERSMDNYEIPTKLSRSPGFSHLQGQQCRHLRPNTINIDSQDDLSDYQRPHSEDKGKKNGFYARLGVLLGGKGQESPRMSSLQPDLTHLITEDTYANVVSSEAHITRSANTVPATNSSVVNDAGIDNLQAKRELSCEKVAAYLTSCPSWSLSPLATNFRRQLSERMKESSPVWKRSAFIRRSDRRIRTSFAADSRGYSQAYTMIPVSLKPMFFEVPQTETEPLFYGRQWLYREIEQELMSNTHNNQGVVITGGPGSGKTSIVLQLVDYSSFSRRREDSSYYSKDTLSSSGSDAMSTSSGDGSPIYQSQLSLTQEAARFLGGHVVAYHFCQADNNITCLVPEYVHNMAAQLCQSPQLVGYRELLLKEKRFQDLLAMSSCIADPSTAFIKGILEPLHSLRKLGRIANTSCLVVLDGLNEAEFHRPDYGDTIASFLTRHIPQFPPWLKVIVTVRTAFQEIVSSLAFHFISLDRVKVNHNLEQDMYDYLLFRISSSPAIRANISLANMKSEGCSYMRFANHLVSVSKGCMLYLKLTLDLIEKGHLVIKSSSYKVLPVSICELYLLCFNLKFTTIQSFDRVTSLLQCCLAALSPLTSLELYHTINAGILHQPITWQKFLQRLNILTTSNFLIVRRDKTLMFAHPSLREWLIRREHNEGTKFLCDVRTGHALISFRLSRMEAPLGPNSCLEFGHHVLKAHVYKSMGRDMPPGIHTRDLQALWIYYSTYDLSRGLCAVRNVYNPNVKVSRLLLLAGANPNSRTNQLEEAPLIVAAVHQGQIGMVSLLLEFGAYINGMTSTGLSPLSTACKQGSLEIIHLLLAKGAKTNQPDKSGKCALVHAAMNGHLEVIKRLTKFEWTGDPGLETTAQQAFVSAAQNSHIDVCKFMLSMVEVNINATDDLTGQTALTAACFAGHVKVCEFLLRYNASVFAINSQGEPPLICAVTAGHWKLVEILLNHNATLEGTNNRGCTALMMAAKEGHLGVLELLLFKGASVNATDNQGMNALCWACSRGQLEVVQILLSHGSDIHHTDKHEQTPLDLAATQGDPVIIQLLLDKGASTTRGNMRPLDRAVACNNVDAVSCFLQKGTKLGPQTWSMAEGKTEVLHVLLRKLLDDGTTLYKRGRLKEAAHRYQYGLRKFPPEESLARDYQPTFRQLKFQFLVTLSGCKRKIKDYDSAIETAKKAVEVNPKAFEGYYARARAKQESGQLQDAFNDITEALRLAPMNQNLRKSLSRLKDELTSAREESEQPIVSSTPSRSGNFTEEVSRFHTNTKLLSEPTECMGTTSIVNVFSQIPSKPLECTMPSIETMI